MSALRKLSTSTQTSANRPRGSRTIRYQVCFTILCCAYNKLNPIAEEIDEEEEDVFDEKTPERTSDFALDGMVL